MKKVWIITGHLWLLVERFADKVISLVGGGHPLSGEIALLQEALKKEEIAEIMNMFDDLPPEDQEELVKFAREITAKEKGDPK